MINKKELLVIKEWLLKIKEIFVKFVFIIEFLIIGIFMPVVNDDKRIYIDKN